MTITNCKKGWVLTYDLSNAVGISKDDIAKASNDVFMVSIPTTNATSYDMPSTTLWASRNKLPDMTAVRNAFYETFKRVKNSNNITVKKLLICDFLNDKVYIENN